MNKLLNTLLVILTTFNLVIWTGFFDLEKENGSLSIYVLDVGQGDSILIKTPSNRYGLIDAGKGNKVVYELSQTLPFFERDLDFLVITHSDLDHMEGALSVLERYKVKTIFLNKPDEWSPVLEELMGNIKDMDVTSYLLIQENDFSFDGVEFNVVWPDKKQSLFPTLESNNLSIAIEISYKNFTFFAAGDLESNYEIESTQELVNHKVDVLKVSHHGSDSSTDSTFIEKISPLVAVISVGKNNTYNHPTKRVLETLTTNSVSIYRTDQLGRIKLKTDGKQMCISSTYQQQCFQNI